MTIGAAIQKLRDAYPREPLSDASVRLYATDLADLDDREVYEAVTRLVRRETRRPTVAHIRMEVAEAIADLPDASAAWALAMRGSSGGHPEVRAAVDSCGGFWTIRYTQNIGTVRAQFERDYERRRLRALHTLAGAAVVSVRQIEPPTGIHARTVAAIPESTRIRPRPITVRLSYRYAGRIVPPVPAALHDEQRQEIIRDAIELLREGPTVPDDPLWIEAHRVLDEAGR